MQVCNLCGAQFQFDQVAFDGNYIKRYQLHICRSCWEANQEGYTTAVEEKFLAHLKAKGIPIPERNAKGWFPRE